MAGMVSVGITRSGTTATVTTSPGHGLSDGDPVKISGATQADYNGIFQISYISTTVFNIEVANSPTTPATGTIALYVYTETYFKFTKYARCGDRDLYLHESDGHVYEGLSTLYQDAGKPINLFVRTTRIDSGDSKIKVMNRIGIIADKVSSTAMMRWSNDDKTTDLAYRIIDLNVKEPMLRKCGAFQRRSIEFRHVLNKPLDITDIEINGGP